MLLFPFFAFATIMYFHYSIIVLNKPIGAKNIFSEKPFFFRIFALY